MNQDNHAAHKFGIVALAGPPNVGKSTLINRIIGEKISIISKRPQTTRHRILGIKTRSSSQIVFVDTPGLHSDQNRILNKVIHRTAMSSLSDVDLMLFMIDHNGWSISLEKTFHSVLSKTGRIILLINKIDRQKNKSKLLPLIDQSQGIHKFLEILPISATKLNNESELLDAITKYLPSGPPGYPDDQITDRSDRFLAGEFVREQTYLSLGQELPYSIAAEVIKFETGDNNVIYIDVVLWVDKPGQKSIVIGKDGGQLKIIGSAARRQMEKSFNKKVFLNLWVKVKKGWANRASILQSLGYAET